MFNMFRYCLDYIAIKKERLTHLSKVYVKSRERNFSLGQHILEVTDGDRFRLVTKNVCDVKRKNVKYT